MTVRQFRKIAEGLAEGMGLTANDIRWDFLTQGHQGNFKTTRYALFDDTDKCSDYLTPMRAELSAKDIVVCYGGIFCSHVEGDTTEFDYDRAYQDIEFINLTSSTEQQEKVPAPLDIKCTNRKQIYFVENSKGISFSWDNNKMYCAYQDGVLKPGFSMNSWGVFMCWAKEKGMLPKIRTTRVVSCGSFLPALLPHAKALATLDDSEVQLVFNDVPLIINKDSDLGQVLEHFHNTVFKSR